MNSSEEWRTIKDYENYQVSSYGRVKSLARQVDCGDFIITIKEKILKNCLGRYLTVCLRNDTTKKTFPVHRLVAREFLRTDLTVDHIDGNRHNNMLDNLEIVTQAENNLRMWARIKGNNRGLRYRWGKWEVAIRCKGKYHHLGRFLTKEEAISIHQSKYLELFGRTPTD